jgi:hypothetical protein
MAAKMVLVKTYENVATLKLPRYFRIKMLDLYYSATDYLT